jgi:hypothetical protein
MKGPGAFNDPAATDCDTLPVDRGHSAELVILKPAGSDAKVFRDSQRVANSHRDFLLGVYVETFCLS